MPPRAMFKALCLFLGVALAAGLLVALPPPLARAAAISVTTTADEINADGDCSLREAIRAANLDQAVDACPAGSGADTIDLPTGIYIITIPGINEDAALTGDLDITEALTITGADKADTIIEGNGLDRVFHIRADVEIGNVTITGGDSGTDFGGGVYVTGALTLTGSRVTGNSGRSGIYVYCTTCTFMAIDSRISGNSTSVNGGGIYNNGTTTLLNSVVDGNTAALDGGGVYNASTLVLVNSTISGNSANRGGGIGTAGASTTSLYNATIADNDASTGGGLYILSTLTARNSIIGNNTDNATSTLDPDCAGTLTGAGYNLIEDPTGCTLVGYNVGTLLHGGPGLGPLRNNGGPTLTHALLSNSVAINRGNPSGCVDQNDALLTTDQRGFLRDSGCDIGAFEANSSVVPTHTATATASPTHTVSPTRTFTASPSATRTPTPTNTPTLSALASATASLTPSATRTFIPDGVPPSPTTSPTPSATRTFIPDGAPPSPTPSATRTPGGAPEVTPSATATTIAAEDYKAYLPNVQK